MSELYVAHTSACRTNPHPSVDVFSQLVQQIQPAFVVSRSLYEVRERPAKTYSWKVFMLTNILVEFPWNTFAGIALFFCWYFPIGLYRNAEAAGDTVARGGQMLMFMLGFLWFASTFSHLMIAALPTAEAASNLGNLFFSLAVRAILFHGPTLFANTSPGVVDFLWGLDQENGTRLVDLAVLYLTIHLYVASCRRCFTGSCVLTVSRQTSSKECYRPRSLEIEWSAPSENTSNSTLEPARPVRRTYKTGSILREATSSFRTLLRIADCVS